MEEADAQIFLAKDSKYLLSVFKENPKIREIHKVFF